MGGQNLAGLTTTRLPTDSRRPEDAHHAACVTESRAWGGARANRRTRERVGYIKNISIKVLIHLKNKSPFFQYIIIR